jgi:hypothetical protein
MVSYLSFVASPFPASFPRTWSPRCRVLGTAGPSRILRLAVSIRVLLIVAARADPTTVGRIKGRSGVEFPGTGGGPIILALVSLQQGRAAAFLVPRGLIQVNTYGACPAAANVTKVADIRARIAPLIGWSRLISGQTRHFSVTEGSPLGFARRSRLRKDPKEDYACDGN